LIAFNFLWSLRRLRDSLALDTQILGFLTLVIIFSTLINNRWTLLKGAYLGEIAECLVPTNGTLDKYCLLFSCPWVVRAIQTSVFQFTESLPVTLTAFYPVLIFAFKTAILISIIIYVPATRTFVHSPLFLILQLLLLLPLIFHL
jgi:hypothetical protein